MTVFREQVSEISCGMDRVFHAFPEKCLISSHFREQVPRIVTVVPGNMSTGNALPGTSESAMCSVVHAFPGMW